MVNTVLAVLGCATPAALQAVAAEPQTQRCTVTRVTQQQPAAAAVPIISSTSQLSLAYQQVYICQ